MIARTLRGTRLSTALPCVVRATWAVSTSPVMPDFLRYVSLVNASARPPATRGPIDLAAARDVRRDLALPWAPARTSAPVDVYAALVSFVDDYDGAFPESLFPSEEVRVAQAALSSRAHALGRPLSTMEQLAHVAPLCGGRVFASAVVLHALTRQLARFRDARALGDAIAPGDVGTRLRLGQWVSAFPSDISRGGDPLGDTYHYWANFVVGAYSAVLEAERRREALALRFMFENGALLMKSVRAYTFHNTLFFGTHAGPDALGLREGRAAVA